MDGLPLYDTATGIVSRKTHRSVDDTVERLRALLDAKGITLFALIDHSGEAAKAGMAMPPTKLLIFGSPKSGTPLMVARPSVAIDLPLKVLVAQDASGEVHVSFNGPEYIRALHGLPPAFSPSLAVVEALVAAAAG